MSRVFRQIATAVLVATILFALAACSRSSGGDHGKDVAATVNGKEIMLSEVDRLVSERSDARKRRDWRRSDELRDELQKLGWSVEDTPSGPRLTPRR